jgi:hypothetical protein
MAALELSQQSRPVALALALPAGHRRTAGSAAVVAALAAAQPVPGS